MQSKKNISTAVLVIFISVCWLNAQSVREKKAQKAYDKLDYGEAIVFYESLIEKKVVNQNVLQNLGNSHYFNANYEASAKWYRQLLETYGEAIEPEYLYRYAQSLKSLEDYKASDFWMAKYVQSSSAEKRAESHSKNTDYLERIRTNSGNFKVKLADFNSEYADFSPSYYKGRIIYTSNRETGVVARNIHKWNRNSFLNLYQVDSGQNTRRWDKSFATKAHESSTCFTKDGNTVYFTRNNFDRSFKRDQKGLSRLKIYRSIYENGKWQEAVPLPFNSADYSVAHPALNKEGNRLYFSSDMPGTLGESDIFYVDIKENGGYGEPVNLGGSVNTEARETFPFIADGILYFASDGHPGLGGLDIFAVSLEEGAKKELQNLGTPINTDEDDFSLILDNSTKTGYFASNRPNGVGSDDIYGFVFEKPLEFKYSRVISGEIVDKESGLPLTNARIVVTDANGTVIAESISDGKGTFDIEIEHKEESLTIAGSKAGYGEFQEALDTNKDVSALKLSLGPLEKREALEMPPIYFGFDRNDVTVDAKKGLERLVAYLKKYPEVKIETASHTDSRGSDEYNRILSLKRTQSIKRYLMEQGINADRIIAEGYGESRLLNRCANGVDCSKEEHNQNRRTEFTIKE